MYQTRYREPEKWRRHEGGPHRYSSSQESPYLEPGTPVFAEDLEAWEKRVGLKVGSVDAIFLRRGRWARRAKLGPWPVNRNGAGYHASVAPWLKARGVSFLGADDAQDVTPSRVEGINLPVHTLAITALGIDVLDNQDLEAVPETAPKHNRWEFLLTVAPGPRDRRDRVPGECARDLLRLVRSLTGDDAERSAQPVPEVKLVWASRRGAAREETGGIQVSRKTERVYLQWANSRSP